MAKHAPLSAFTTKAREGFKFIGPSTGEDDSGVGELFEGLEAVKSQQGDLFINRSEDPYEPDWVGVLLVYEVPISAAITPIDEDDIKSHPDL